ncbi:hypothetical protein J7M28_04055 [bacterium]|nr:hypothetical protein [bacterium]
MTRKSLVIMSICLLLGAGFAAYVWASACCGEVEGCLCNGWCSCNDEEDCEYDFNVYLDSTKVTGTSVRVYYEKEAGGPTHNTMLTRVDLPPYNLCVLYRQTVELDPVDYLYWFESTGECTDRDPEDAAKHLLQTKCE